MSAMSRIRFVYFDLDDTLLDHRHAERAALADVYAAYRFPRHSLDEVRTIYHELNLDVWRRYALGELTKDQAKRERFARLLAACDVIGVEPGVVSELYFRHYADHWRWCDGAEAAFFAIAEKFPVGVVTNGFSAIQHAKLGRFPALRDRLAALVISEEVGHMKPAPALFRHATERAGVAGAEILYVGDSLFSDVRGGLAAGWQVAWYGPHVADDTEPGAFRFDQWRALLAHLGL